MPRANRPGVVAMITRAWRCEFFTLEPVQTSLCGSKDCLVQVGKALLEL
jgi:hypothetical protein